MWRDLEQRKTTDISEQINLKIKSLGFIVQGNLADLRIHENISAATVYEVGYNTSFVVHNFATPVDIVVNGEEVIIPLTFAAEVSLATFDGSYPNI